MFLDDGDPVELEPAEDSSSVDVPLVSWPNPAPPDRRDNMEGCIWTLKKPKEGDEAGLRHENMLVCAGAEAAAVVVLEPPL